MSNMAFDTLKFADKLQTMGYTKEDAEKQARVQAEVVEIVFDQQVATKRDLDRVENRLSSEVKELDTKLSSEIKDLNNRIDKVEIKVDHLKEDVHALRSEVKAGDEAVVNRLFARLSGVILGGLGLAVTLLHYWV